MYYRYCKLSSPTVAHSVGPHCSALGPRVAIPLKKYSYAYYLSNATLVDYVGYPGAMLFLLPCQHILAETEAACPQNTNFPATSAKLCQPSN